MNTLDATNSAMVSMHAGYALQRTSTAGGPRFAANHTGVFCVVAFLFALAPHVQAQSSAKQMPVLLLSPAGGETNLERADVVRGLREAHLRAVQVADVSVDPVYAACRQADCAADAAHTAGMPALLCSLQGGIVELRWVAPEDGIWTERVEIARGGLVSAIAELAQRILLRRALGWRALLRVNSQPSGARVLVDGKLAGLTPLEQTWEPGTHIVSVELEGYTSEQADASLGSGAVHELRFELRADPGAVSGLYAPPQLQRSAANYALGSALALAAVPLLIVGANTVIDQGQCLESEAGRCTQRAEVGTAQTVMLGAGVVSLLGAAYFFIAQPLRVSVDVLPRAAAVSVSGRF